MISAAKPLLDLCEVPPSADADRMYQYTLLHAMIQSHPNPAALLDQWRKLSAITTANMVSSMISRGVPGHGSEEITDAFNAIDGSIIEAVVNLTNR